MPLEPIDYYISWARMGCIIQLSDPRRLRLLGVIGDAGR